MHLPCAGTSCDSTRKDLERATLTFAKAFDGLGGMRPLSHKHGIRGNEKLRKLRHDRGLGTALYGRRLPSSRRCGSGPRGSSYSLDQETGWVRKRENSQD